MCGRYFIDDGDRDLREILEELDEKYNIKTGEIFPTDTAPVIKPGGAAAVKWGFPRRNSGGVVINARAETAMEKAMFRESILKRRCVIPSSGFYEWHRADGAKRKDKYCLKKAGENILYMAGIWSAFKGPGGEYEAFVILTTQANGSMIPPDMELSLFTGDRKPIHDRMPVILDGGELADWLSVGEFMEYALRRPGPELTLEPAP